MPTSLVRVHFPRWSVLVVCVGGWRRWPERNGLRSLPSAVLLFLGLFEGSLIYPTELWTVALTLPHTWASAGGIRYKVSFRCTASGEWAEAWGVPQPAVHPHAPRGLCCRRPWPCRNAAPERVLLRVLSPERESDWTVLPPLAPVSELSLWWTRSGYRLQLQVPEEVIDLMVPKSPKVLEEIVYFVMFT